MSQQRVWGAHDDGLLRAIWLARLAEDERLTEADAIAPTFALADASERVLAASPYELLLWRAPGDGTYLHSGTTLLATGRSGLALTAGVMAGTAAANARRRRRASMDATPRWLSVDHGHVWVSTHGFRLQSVHGLTFSGWEHVESVQVLQQGLVQVHATSASGPVSLRLASVHAEAIFVMWVLARGAVHHPDWQRGSWIPPRWRDWAIAQGRRVPAVAALPRSDRDHVGSD